ncbi:MAG: flagellar hook-length control protein FliK [Sporomusaceae bacterium]|nr:flagellar hook-length control protein FliK [Sporomusaceae bacterium]
MQTENVVNLIASVPTAVKSSSKSVPTVAVKSKSFASALASSATVAANSPNNSLNGVNQPGSNTEPTAGADSLSLDKQQVGKNVTSTGQDDQDNSSKPSKLVVDDKIGQLEDTKGQDTQTLQTVAVNDLYSMLLAVLPQQGQQSQSQAVTAEGKANQTAGEISTGTSTGPIVTANFGQIITQQTQPDQLMQAQLVSQDQTLQTQPLDNAFVTLKQIQGMAERQTLPNESVKQEKVVLGAEKAQMGQKTSVAADTISGLLTKESAKQVTVENAVLSPGTILMQSEGSTLQPDISQLGITSNKELQQATPTEEKSASKQNEMLTALQSQGKLVVDQQTPILPKEQVVSQDSQPSQTQEASVALIDNKLREQNQKFSDKGEQQMTFTSQEQLKANNVAETEVTSLGDTTQSAFAQMLHSEKSTTPLQGVSASSAASSNNQPVSSQDNFQVVQQIIDQVKLVNRSQNTEMVIRLKPEHLGELTLKVTVEQGAVTASFHSGNSDVRAVIESSLPQLKQELTNSGLKVDNVGVYTSLNQFMSNQERPTQQQQKPKFSYKGNKDNFEETVEAVTKPVVTEADGVDYLI